MSGETIITVIGNATDDAQLRFTPAGHAVANWTVASTPRTYDRQAGEWRDGQSLFLRCSIWRQQAENVAASVKRGTRLVVTGKLTQRSFEAQSGEKRTVVELEAEEVAISLKYGEATFQKTSGGGGSSSSHGAGPGADDPWGSAPPAGAPVAEDEPPF